MKRQICLSLILSMLLVIFSPTVLAASVNITFLPDREDYVFSLNGTEGVEVTVSGINANCKYTAYVSDDDGTRVWSKTGTFAAQDGIKLIPYNKKIGSYYLSVSVYAGDRAYKLNENYSVLQKMPKSDVLGIQNGNVLSKHGMVLDKAARAGMGITRIDLLWEAVEKQKGKLSLDGCVKELEYIQRAKEQGMEVMAILCRGNTLYTDTVFDMPKKGTDAFDAYLAYCNFVVEKLKPYGVKYFCVWNEPNNAAGQTATSSSDAQSNNPQLYADLLNAAAPVIRNANSEAVIIAGRIAGGCSGDTSYSYKGTTMSSKTYITKLFESGMKSDSFDVFAIHPYMAWEGPPDEPRFWHTDYLLSNQIDALETIMDNNGYGDKSIWITELGYSSNFTSEGQSTVRNLSEETKAAYNARHGIMALADGRAEKVVYHVSEYNDGFVFFEKNTLIPHESYFSVAAMNLFLNGKTATGKVDAISNSSKAYSAYLFEDDTNEEVLVLWARGNAANSAAEVNLTTVLEEVSYACGMTDGICYDYMGNNAKRVSLTDTVTLDCKPTYIVLSEPEGTVKIDRNEKTITFSGHTLNDYIGVSATDSSNELWYINQFNTAENGNYTFDTKLTNSGVSTFYVVDGNRRIPFTVQLNSIELDGMRNDGESTYVKSLAQLKDGTIVVTLSTDDTHQLTSAYGVLAFYKEDGRMLSVKLTGTNLSIGASSQEIRFDNVEIPDECGLVKCMLWEDLQNINPIADAKTLE